MQAHDFIRKWGPQGIAHDLNERGGAQAHFIDLCRVLGVPEPADPEHYCFERGVTKTGSTAVRTDGFADVWLRGHFAWEYKAPGKSLEGALKQLMMYALPLENPPLLVVSDRLRIEVHTHFTGTPSEKHVFALEEMARPEVQQRLRALWQSPDDYKPRRSNRDITEEGPATASLACDGVKRSRMLLWPSEWTDGVPEVVPLGMTTSPYPDRIVEKPGFEKEVAQRTLTIYNQPPARLPQAHEALDAAVAAA